MKNRIYVASVLLSCGLLAAGLLGAADDVAAPPVPPMPAAAAEAPVSAVSTSAPEAVSIAPAVVDTNLVIIPAGTAAQLAKEETISLHLEEAQLADVVKMFRRATRANIITEVSNLTGTVTVDLEDVPWKVGLDSVLSQRGLRLEDSEGKGVYTITAKLGEEPLVTESIFLKYAEVPAVLGVVKNMLIPRGKISDFASRNAMVVQSSQKNINEIKAVIEQIDIPRRQVYIEAQFVELADIASEAIGIGWDKMLRAYEIGGSATVLQKTETLTRDKTRENTLTMDDSRAVKDEVKGSYNVRGENLTPLTTPTLRTTTDTISQNQGASEALGDTASKAVTEVRTAVLNPLELSLVLSALKSRNGASVLSNPKIIVANGEQAMIHIGEERRPFIAQVTPATQITAPFTTYNPGEAVQFGVKVIVTPTINTDSNITVMIEPELTRLAGMDTAPDGKTSYPIKATKKIKTQFILENNKTAAIGGLTETKDDKTSDKIPLLGDIPLLGKYLFSRETKSRNQQEMIIFVTVGLCTPAAAGDKSGIPSDAEMIHQYQIEQAAAKQKFQGDMQKIQDEVSKQTEKSEKRKRLLLNRTR